MAVYQDEIRISLLPVLKSNTGISKVYKKKAVIYGSNIDVYEFPNVKVTFRRKERDTTRRLSEAKTRNEASVRRARTQVRRLTEANVRQWGNYKPIFSTLTQKENIESLITSNRRFSLFVKRLSYAVGHDLKYVAVPEFQKRGSVHYHIIFFNLPYIDVHKFEKVWGFGMTNIQVIKKIDRTGHYLAKYFTKAVKDPRLFQKKAYFSSRGLLRPVDIYGGSEVDELLNDDTLKLVHTAVNNDVTFKKYASRTSKRSIS